MASEKVVLKLSYGGETHRMKVWLRPEGDDVAFSYALLLQKVREVFPRLSGAWTLVYRDDEGDVVTLTHASEFDEACRVLLELNAAEKGKPRGLHFCVVSRVSLREKVVTPVLQKVVELVRLAGEATSQLRNSELLGRGRESVTRLAGEAINHAGDAITQLRNSELVGRGRESLGSSVVHTRTLLSSARSGVSSRLRRASSVVAAGIERRRSSSASSDDGNDTLTACEFTKSPSTAVPPCSPEAVMTVDLRHSDATTPVPEPSVEAEANVDEEEEDEDVPPPLIQVEAAEEEQTEEIYESDADTQYTTSCDEEEDREWDIVDTAGADTIAEDDGQWARELDVLRSILVHLDEELCCDLLTQHNGSVEAVLVELTNM